MFEFALNLIAMIMGFALAISLGMFVTKRIILAIRVNRRAAITHARAVIASPAARVMVAALVVSALALATPALTLAQTAEPSVQIDFGADDLGIFFDWFNTIFAALLPIALLGAGLTAGGLFVWVIARMLIRAFSNMLGGGQG